jgi:hypothetical protein
MTATTGQAEHAWLRAFFGPPNGVDWASLEQRAVSRELLDQILPWLEIVEHGAAQTPVVLPFIRAGEIVGWYATTRGPARAFELRRELTAWLGPTYLARFDELQESSADPMAAAMRQRFGGTVYRFAGASTGQMAERLMVFAKLARQRPATTTMLARPVGTIRSDFERALIVQDGVRAEAFISELRETGRLNEENLRYLDVRLKAGLGLWPQIARDHWLVKTLSDLPMPAQILADLIDALYRTYLEEPESIADSAALIEAFKQHLALPFPRLFASRRGIRTPRVVKAFLLFERALERPNAGFLNDLVALLPADDPALRLFLDLATNLPVQKLVELPGSPTVPVVGDAEAAEEAFEDGQYDRAFALYRSLPLSRRVLQRLLACTLFIDTDDVRRTMVVIVDTADPAFAASLPDPIRAKVDGLRDSLAPMASAALPVTKIDSWMAWANALASGGDTAKLSLLLERALTWDVSELTRHYAESSRFVGLLGGLSGEAASLARRAVPAIYNAVFPDGTRPDDTTRPIAILLFDLIALDETLTPTDLDLLLLLVELLITTGVSRADYINLVSGLEDVQRRVGSISHLTWSLDMAEALAVSPVPTDAAREARRQFFLLLVGQAQLFAHRLERQAVLPFRLLCRDYGLGDEVLGAIRLREAVATDIGVAELSGKTIAIYSLVEAAAARARLALLEMFPGVRVETNADTVATARLISLAKTADIFVFAWKSSSHQAYYCVKDAMGDREPIMAAGKGTASLLRAVLDSLR